MQGDDQRTAAAMAVDSATVPAQLSTNDQVSAAVERLLVATHLRRAADGPCPAAPSTAGMPGGRVEQLLAGEPQSTNEALYHIHVSLPARLQRQNQLWMKALEGSGLDLKAGAHSSGV